MKRFFQLLVALALFLGGAWFLYGGYERQLSLAGRTETGLTYLKTGVDGKTRVLSYHWNYGIGAALILGSVWWLTHGHKPKRRRR